MKTIKKFTQPLTSIYERIKRGVRDIRETTISLKFAADKYNDIVSDPYNFLDVNNNIRMHEELIREEDKHLLGKRRQTAIVLTIFGLLFVYFPQIVAFLLFGDAEWWYYLVSGLYFLGSIASIICFVLYIWPLDIPQHISPTYFFETDLKQYLEEGYDEEQANIGVKYSYLKHLGKFLEMLQKANRRKGLWHYRCIICLSVTFLFYFATSAIVIASNKTIEKTETNKQISNMADKKKFDPAKTHDVPPQVIKEGQDVKFVNTTSKPDSTNNNKH